MLETTKSKMLLSQSFKQNANSFTIEGDVIVPDSMPDIANVLYIDCIPSIEDESVNSGQITLTGSCEFNIIYASDEDTSKIVRISTSMPFKNSFEASGITVESNCRVNVLTEDVQFSVLNSRKVNLNSLICLAVCFFNNSEIAFVADIPDEEGTNILSENKDLITSCNLIKNSCSVKDTYILPMSLPNIKDIIKYEAHISNEESAVSENKIIFKGDLLIRIFYVSNHDSKIYSFDISLPFSNFENSQVLDDINNVDVQSIVNNLSLNVLPDSDDLMRIIEFNAAVSTDILVIKKENIHLITDLYNTQKSISPNIEPVSHCVFSPKQVEEISLRGIINIPENETISILSAFSRVKSINLDSSTEKKLLKGILDITIIYQIPSSQKINSVSIDMPMEHLLASEINDILCINILSTDAVQSEMGKFDVKVTLSVTGQNTVCEEINILKDISESENSVDRLSGITIYYVKSGDSFWKIAKKFNTTIDKLQKINPEINPENLLVGQMLII